MDEIVDNQCFKVIIAGSRGFNNYEQLKHVCNYMLRNKENIQIVSGGARGADKLGERYANYYGYSIKQFIPDWDKFGKSAGYIRNSEMADYADALIAFWDGQSKGTEHMINLAKQGNLKVKISYYTP